MTDYEQKGYDAFVAAMIEGVPNSSIDFNCFDKAVKKHYLQFQTNERREFVRGWLKARDES